MIPDVSLESRHPANRLPALPYRAEFSVPLLLPRERIEAHGALTTLFPHVHSSVGPQSDDFDRLAAEAAALVVRVP